VVWNTRRPGTASRMGKSPHTTAAGDTLGAIWRAPVRSSDFYDVGLVHVLVLQRSAELHYCTVAV